MLYDACGLDDLSPDGIAQRIMAHEGRLMTHRYFGDMLVKEATAHCFDLRNTQSHGLGDACFHAVKHHFDCALTVLFAVSHTSDRP